VGGTEEQRSAEIGETDTREVLRADVVHISVPVEENVLWLDVRVDDAHRVQSV
jgi:hypothetical protein